MKTPIILYRIFHGLISIFFIGCIVYIYLCAISGQISLWLLAAIAVLAAEGLAVALNHGDCPLSGFQHRLGDPVPFFALILPAPLAKKAIPFFTILTLLGVALAGLRIGMEMFIR